MEDLNIRHFKLVNGEDIIAIVSSKNKDNWLVERPVVVVNGLLGGKDIPKDVEVARGDIKAYLQLATILGRSDDMVSYEVNDWFLMHDTLVRDNAIIFLNNCDDLKEAMYLCGYTSERTEPMPNLEFSSIPRI